MGFGELLMLVGVGYVGKGYVLECRDQLVRLCRGRRATTVAEYVLPGQTIFWLTVVAKWTMT